MSLITKTVKVKWHPSNKKHYETLGYIFTKMGDEFEVDVEDFGKIALTSKNDLVFQP